LIARLYFIILKYTYSIRTINICSKLLFLLFHATVWTAGPGCRQIPLATLARQGPSTSWPVAKERGSGIRVQGTGIRDPGPRNGHPGSGSTERESGIRVYIRSFLRPWQGLSPLFCQNPWRRLAPLWSTDFNAYVCR